MKNPCDICDKSVVESHVLIPCGQGCPAYYEYPPVKAAIAANNAGWIAWGEGKCPHEPQNIACGPNNAYYEERKFEYKFECPLCWQERKKRLEVKQATQ